VFLAATNHKQVDGQHDQDDGRKARPHSHATNTFHDASPRTEPKKKAFRPATAKGLFLGPAGEPGYRKTLRHCGKGLAHSYRNFATTAR
jgi:hypothetical protein